MSERAIGLQRWLRCKFAATQIEKMSEGYFVNGGFPQEGFNSDYSCDNEEMIAAISRTDLIDLTNPIAKIDTYIKGDNVIYKAVEMHPFGQTSEFGVIETLDLWCRDCPFFKPKVA